MPLVNAKCTSCGATLEVDSSKEALVCKYCGSAFVVEQAINNYNITNNINAQNVTIVNQTEKNDFEIVAGKLIKYKGASTDVVIPEGVTEIGEEAIPDGVKSVMLPNSVTIIGDHAFQSCKSLTSVTIPDSVTTIGQGAFQDCTSLISFTIPNSVTTIGNSAFRDCTSLTSVTIPNSVTTIGDSAFYNCTSLTCVTIPNSVTTIRSFAFCGCTSLTSVTIPNSVTIIGNHAFQNCKSLTSVTIPDSVTTIGNSAFRDCTSLTSVMIPNSVKTIEEDAFNCCKSLSSVTILGNPSIHPEAFLGTPWKQQESGGCYVATCVYGSYDCPEVWTLRRYRDNTLAETWYGRAFIHTYYAVSPTIVKLFGETEWFKKMWRGRLDRMVADLQAKGVENTPYEDRNW